MEILAMKKLINNFKASLKHNRQKSLILILVFLAGVELLGLIYAFNIIRSSQKENLFLEQSQSWDYYTLASYLSKDPLYYNETKVIESLGKYLILDPELKIANKALFDKIADPIVLSNDKVRYNNLDSQQFHDYRNSCLSSIINSETVNSFSSLKLDSDTAYIKRGKIRFYLEDYKGAINDFKKAEALNSNNTDQLNQAIALAYFELGNPKYENQHIPDALLLQIDNPSSLRTHLQKQSIDALKYNPNFANAYYLKGYLGLKEISFNFHTDKSVKDIKSNEINNMIEMGIFKNQITHDMISDLTNAIRNDPFFYRRYPINTINPCPVFSDEYPTLIEIATEQIKNEPNDPYLYYKRALIYLKSNNNQKVIEDLKKSLQFSSNDNQLKAVAYYVRWLADYKEKNYQKAIEDISQAIEIHPDFADLYAIRALTYYDFLKNEEGREKVIQDCDQAIKIYKESVKKIKPESMKKNNSLKDSSSLGYSLAILLSDILNNPAHANAYFIRGLAYYAQGNQEQALSDYLQALNLHSGSMWPNLVQGEQGGGVSTIPPPEYFPP
ncbi:MAG: tetratricopeptide repeat protein [Planktothrix sp.]|uniref:tetratricopeptide repeat protein n=2 Tax=Planktothrix sp. TaxID=3088171 RepID=UPI0038D370EF